MWHGKYLVVVEERGIAASDCAAEVVAVGSAVKDFSIGDRVSAIVDQGNITRIEDGALKSLGGDVAGVLRQYAVFGAKYLVHLPKHLTWEEVCSVIPIVMAHMNTNMMRL